MYYNVVHKKTLAVSWKCKILNRRPEKSCVMEENKSIVALKNIYMYVYLCKYICEQVNFPCLFVENEQKMYIKMYK